MYNELIKSLQRNGDTEYTNDTIILQELFPRRNEDEDDY